MATPAEAATARQEELAHSNCRRLCVGVPAGAKDEPEVTAMEVDAGAEFLGSDDLRAFSTGSGSRCWSLSYLLVKCHRLEGMDCGFELFWGESLASRQPLGGF